VSRDVAEDADARDELTGRYGRMATPTLVIDGKTFIGFRENRRQIEKEIDVMAGGSHG
jgi:hypothetical protein